MIEQFTDIRPTTKAEQVRAWCVQAAIEKIGEVPVRPGVVARLADEIEKFVIQGYEKHDDETLTKVHTALMESDFGFKEGDVTSIISCLQNAGILFRERV